MNQEQKKYLHDILECIEGINSYLKGHKDFIYYSKNRWIRKAVERELETIGEAVNRLLKMDSSIEIKNARKIVDNRNFIIHAYDSVDNPMIWATVINDLPNLKIEVERLLNN